MKQASTIRHALIVCLLTLTFTVSASAKDHDFLNKGLFYNILSENTVEIAGVQLSEDQDETFYPISEAIDENHACTVPASVEHDGKIYNVVKVGDKAFYFIQHLLKIVLPDQITEIGDNAFERCYELNSLNMPDQIKKIGRYAFADCENLKMPIVIPQDVTHLEPYAFAGTYFDRIELNADITEIPEGLFYGCRANSIVINSPVKKIGSKSCIFPNIVSFKIPEGVEEIEVLAFTGCGLASIQDSGTHKKSLHTIKLPSTLKRMETGAIFGIRVIDASALTSLPDNFFSGIFTTSIYPYSQESPFPPNSQDSPEEAQSRKNLPHYDDSYKLEYTDTYYKNWTKPLLILHDDDIAREFKNANEHFFYLYPMTRVEGNTDNDTAYITMNEKCNNITPDYFTPIKAGNVFFSMPEDELLIGLIHEENANPCPTILHMGFPVLKPDYFTDGDKRIGTLFKFRPYVNGNYIKITDEAESHKVNSVEILNSSEDGLSYPCMIFTMTGTRIGTASNAADLKNLPKGIYIITDGKSSRKMSF